MHPSQTVLTDLITLSKLEDELKGNGARARNRPELEKTVAKQRKKIPPMVLSHHDRIRAKGRRGEAPVQDWICRACFISIPVGSRQQLTHADDLFICENCGAYIYLPDGTDARPADQLPAESSRAKRIAEKIAGQKPVRKPDQAKPAAAGGDRLAVIKKLSAKLAQSK
jgi:hypothetical protein